MKNNLILFIWLSALGTAVISCLKRELLNSAPSSAYQIPSSLQDLQALLDNESVMNSSPVLGELSADAINISDQLWSSLTHREKNTYIWASSIFDEREIVDDWLLPYQQVFYANVVLYELPHFNSTGSFKQQWNNIKGDAHFKRAYAFYNIAQLFAPPFDEMIDNSLGIPLRLTPVVEVPSQRSTVHQTYNQILADLFTARFFLPARIDSANRNRPSVSAVFAMLARLYHSMRIYDKAGMYADSCLMMYNELIDYNDLFLSSNVPFNRLNKETLYQTRFHATTDCLIGYSVSGCIIDSALYFSYAPGDLRPLAYFIMNKDKLPNIKGSYYGNYQPFSGLAIDEIYLIRAEWHARNNNTVAALTDLNTLLKKRWKAGSYKPITGLPSSDILQLIIAERQKELVMRGLRWTDIRRLNKEERSITLRRKISGQLYELPPNDKRYVLPIPPAIISKTGMPQNPR